MKRFMVCERSLWSIACLAFGFVFSGVAVQAESPATNVARTSPTLVSTGMESNAPVIWHEDFEEGWSVARKSRLPMVIFITSKRCHYCDAMKQNTWCDGEVLRNVKNRFVAIRLSPDRNAEILKRIDVPSYPTTLIGHPDGKIVGHRVGFQPPAAMKKFLQTVGQAMH